MRLLFPLSEHRYKFQFNSAFPINEALPLRDVPADAISSEQFSRIRDFRRNHFRLTILHRVLFRIICILWFSTIPQGILMITKKTVIFSYKTFSLNFLECTAKEWKLNQSWKRVSWMRFNSLDSQIHSKSFIEFIR